jgi:hypothetical protein
MAEVKYRQIAELTACEIAAARAYGAESGLVHLAVQADHSLVLKSFELYQEFLQSKKLVALKRATELRYELAAAATLYSGHGNGVGVVGALGHSEDRFFKGMTWQYRGPTSATTHKSVADNFVRTRANSSRDTPVLLEFRLPAGFRLLPMAVLGADFTHEAECLIPPGLPFVINAASRVTVEDGQDVLHLVLVPK